MYIKCYVWITSVHVKEICTFVSDFMRTHMHVCSQIHTYTRSVSEHDNQWTYICLHIYMYIQIHHETWMSTQSLRDTRVYNMNVWTFVYAQMQQTYMYACKCVHVNVLVVSFSFRNSYMFFYSKAFICSCMTRAHMHSYVLAWQGRICTSA